MQERKPPTYRVRAQFEAKDGHRSWKTRGRGLTLAEAIDLKTKLVERVVWCISAECSPEGGRA